MKKQTSIILLIIALVLLSPIIFLVGATGIYTLSTVEISPNLYVDIPNSIDRLQIIEYTNCWNTKAYIYYVTPIGMRFYIGKTKSSGYVQPFKDGDYRFTFKNLGVSLEWEHQFESEWWKEDYFSYPYIINLRKILF